VRSAKQEPRKALLGLALWDAKCILGVRVVFTNLVALFPGKATIETNWPVKARFRKLVEAKHGCVGILGLLLMPILAACSCSTAAYDRDLTFSGVNLGLGAPTNFIRQVVQANRVIVINTFTNAMPEFSGSRLELTGRKMKSLIRAMTLLKWDGNNVHSRAVCPWALQFYRGRKLVMEADFEDYIIRCGDDEYYDHTGILQKLNDEIRARTKKRDDFGQEE
jgi:hypothetical protein